MPIGNGPDCYNGINPEEDKQIRLQDEVDRWWNSLEDTKRYELVEDFFPGRACLMGLDEIWEAISWNDKFDLYMEDTGQGR